MHHFVSTKLLLSFAQAIIGRFGYKLDLPSACVTCTRHHNLNIILPSQQIPIRIHIRSQRSKLQPHGSKARRCAIWCQMPNRNRWISIFQLKLVRIKAFHVSPKTKKKNRNRRTEFFWFYVRMEFRFQHIQFNILHMVMQLTMWRLLERWRVRIGGRRFCVCMQASKFDKTILSFFCLETRLGTCI